MFEKIYEKIIELLASISWSAAAGIVFGAVISATVSYLLQRNSFAEARRQKALEKFEARKAMGLTLYHKMIRIASTLHIVLNTLNEGVKRAADPTFKGPLWGALRPPAALPDRVKFTPDELTYLMLLDNNLFSDMGSFDEVHNTLLSAFEEYKAKRAAVSDTLSAEMETGGLGVTTLTSAEMRKYGPRFAELNILIEQMLGRAKEDSAEAWTLLNRLQERLNKEFKLNLRLEMK